MKKIMAALLCLLLLNGCTNSNPTKSNNPSQNEVDDDLKNQSFVYQNGLLQVKDGRLMNYQEKEVQLKGISLNNINNYHQYINRDTFKTLNQDWNVNTIRIPISVDSKNGYYLADEKERDTIERNLLDGILYAKELGMYVVIDWQASDPLYYQKDAIAFYRKISKKYRSYNNVMYEICSTPNVTDSWEEISEYATPIIDEIRKNCDNIIIVGTPKYLQDFSTITTNFSDQKNIMYNMNINTSKNASEMQHVYLTILNCKMPVFISNLTLTDNELFDSESSKSWIELLDQNQTSYIAGNLSNDNDPSALLQSSSLSSWSDGELSNSGQWIKNTYTKINDEMNQDMDLTIDINEIWQQDGLTYKQLYFTITNLSEDQEGWGFSLTFSDDVTIVEKWNCETEIKGKTITISNSYYNGSILSKQSIDDVGIIISSKEDAIITKEVINKQL